MKTVIEIDQDIIPTLFDWHGGQWDPVYAVASSLSAGSEENIDKNTLGSAINNLERDHDKLKMSRQEKRDLEYAIEVLKVWYDSMPNEEEYSEEDIEEMTVWEPSSP